jgi:hypothetical protein
MNYRALVALVLAGVLGLPVDALAQQQPANPATPATPPAPAAAPVFDDSADARVTYQRLHQVLRQLPPAVGEVLQRDPSLLTRADYLAPYPTLVAFLQQHPEIARNPSFFLGSFDFRERDPRERSIDFFENILGGMALGVLLFTVAGVFIWLIRAVIEHRRWLRLSRVQVEVHTKLLDRLQSNEDLLAYMQTPAGRRFLEAAPIALDGEPRPGGAPVSRIVLSLQAGIVLIALGIGLRTIEWNMVQEVAEGFRVIGVIAIALGIGFALSAAAAYGISARLGLLAVRKTEESAT